MRLETNLGEKRERRSAEAAPAVGEKDRLINDTRVAIDLVVI